MDETMRYTPNPKGDPAIQRGKSPRRYVLYCCLALVGLFGVFAILIPVMNQVQQSPDRMKCSNDLKQLALALHNYESTYGHLPGSNAPVLDPAGSGKSYPVSWRVLLLTYVADDGHGVPMLKYHFDEPWDGPNNIRLLDHIPKVYRHPKADDAKVVAGYTHYRLLGSRSHTKPSALFTDGLPGPKLKEIPDGLANTLMIVEAGESVPWTMPEVLIYDSNHLPPKLGHLFRQSFLAALADGSTRSFRSDMPEAKLRAWITKDGGEPVDDD